jgi:glutamate dehydrogenase (NADP+)
MAKSKSRSAADSEVQKALDRFMRGLKKRNPGEREFHQAVHEVAETVMPLILDTPEYQQAQILERMTEPDRIIIFRVTWETDDGSIRANRAWRVQFNNSIGPYKGGLRFHPSVNESVLKFLGFEQTFKNALTGLPMGGAKGGANFNPKGKSDREVMRFCQSLMMELHRHIGEDTDIPAGDMGVGSREISYLFGMYKRLENRFTGILTGKGLTFGGSHVRTEATGYGCVYFVENMLNHVGNSLEGKTVAISGSGNVALYAAEKALEYGAKVITLSDSEGFVHDPEGLSADKLAWTKELKEKRRGRISEYAGQYKKATFHARETPWSSAIPCDVALPCATQNEIEGSDAEKMIEAGVSLVAEGANMPCDMDAVHAFQKKRILFAPAKAANAGGVAVSGLEQSQNSLRISWDRKTVDQKLQEIMSDIHKQCVRHGGGEDDHVNYLKGANLAGFSKVAEAMLAYGVV